jgi:hypothetical protein
MLIVNHKEEEAIRYVVDAIRRLDKLKTVINKTIYETK